VDNPDDTFATTLDGIEELRSPHRGTDDWQSWRRVVVQSLRAGSALEKRIASLEVKAGGFAKAGAYTHLDTRVSRLEEQERRRRGLWGTLLKAAGAIGLVVLGHELSKWLK
jgi:hypothetical protein